MPSLPSGIDRIMKEYFDTYQKTVPQTVPSILSSLGVTLFPNTELLATWQNNRKGIQWNDEKGNLLRGAVDYILEKDDKLIVLDFKTRGWPLKQDSVDRYQDQLNIYNFLLQKNGHTTQDYSYLLYLDPKEAIDQDIKVETNVDIKQHNIVSTVGVTFRVTLVTMPTFATDAETFYKKAITLLEGSLPASAEKCGHCKYARSLAQIQ